MGPNLKSILIFPQQPIISKKAFLAAATAESQDHTEPTGPTT